MIEREMENRGSKSIILKFKSNMYCNSFRFITTKVLIKSDEDLAGKKLNPWFVTGFTDAEGSFMISFLKNPRVRSGWQIQSIFQIALHKKDLELLNLLQSYFGGIGKIVKHGKDSYSYRVRSLEENLDKILPHFDQYSLKTQKFSDYLLWREVVLMMQRKEHLTDKGVQTIVNIRASLNLGLSDDLKVAFPKTIPVKKAGIVDQKIPHPEWLAGFTSGEGNFAIRTPKSQTEVGFKAEVWFRISQHSRDEELMRSIISYLECGYLVKDLRNPAVEFSVYKFSDICGKIFPFFRDHKIRGVKAKDFQDWCLALKIIQAKGHLTQEGIDKIRKIKAGMNKSRCE